MTIIIRGDIVFTPRPDRFTVLEDGCVAVGDDGRVTQVAGSPSDIRLRGTRASGDRIVPTDGAAPRSTVDSGEPEPRVIDRRGCLVIPSFVDLHVHAPQYPMAGVGLDEQLLRWLENTTFPVESHFADPQVAGTWYRRFLHRMWRVGTLRFSAFATLHEESTLMLMGLCQESGLRPVVGKVNMDRNAPEELLESARDSLESTRRIIGKSRAATPDIGYVVTPRFVPSTTPELMEGLGEIVREFGLPVQSHLDENRSEVEWVRRLHPDVPTYAQVYDRFGLMPEGRTIMAHCIWMTQTERRLLRERGVWAAHCPQSNLNLASGLMPVRRSLDAGIKVCVASDVAAGHDPSMPRQIVSAIETSKAKTFETGHENDRPLALSEAFYMATKRPGEFFGAIGRGRVGTFEPGCDFDALVIREEDGNPLDLPPEGKLARFIYDGDDRDILERWIAGRTVPEPFA